METANKNQITMAILSVSLITVMAGAVVAPAMGSLSLYFSDQPPSLLKLVLTLPPLLVIPTAIVVGRLTDWISQRRLLLIGLVLYLVGGLGGAFSDNFIVLLCFRAVVGLSVGIVMPISTGLVSEFFHGKQAQKMMGWISAANHFGGMTAQLISGALAVISWRYSFFVYGIALMALFLVALWLPEPNRQRTVNESTPLPLKTYCYAGFMLLLMLVFYTVPLNVSLLVEGTGLGSSTASGIACALATGAPFFVGIYFQKIASRLGVFAVFVALCVMGAGMLMVGDANSLIMIFAGTFLVGAGEGYLFPHIMNAIRATVAPKDSVKALAVMSSMLYLGQFLSPVVIDALGGFCIESTISQPFKIAWGLCLFAATISFGYSVKQKVGK